MSDTSGQVISWYVLRGHLRTLLDRAQDQMDEASDEEVKRLQGERRILKKLLNLPETLAILDQEDRRVAALEAKKS